MKPLDEEVSEIKNHFEQSIFNEEIPFDQIIEIDKLTGDASTRRYFRLFSKQSSYVVCLDRPTEQSKEEFPFFQVHQFLFDNKVRVPHLFSIDLKSGYLLEEDLGDVTLLRHLIDVKDKKHELEIYKKCVDLIVSFQKLDVPNDDSFIYRKLSFDFNKLMAEMDFTLDYFISKFLKHKLSDKDTVILKNHLGNICLELSKCPMVFTHRDYHSRNIMVKDEEFILIDFQDARMGIPQYDLVSLLEDCYYDINEENRDELKEYYYKKLPFTKLGQNTYEEFIKYYDLMLVQRVFKAVGSFAYIYNWRRDNRYIKYIGFGMEKIRNTIAKYPEHDELRKTLYKIYYEN